MNNFQLYARITRVIAFITLFVVGSLSQFFYKEFFFRHHNPLFFFVIGLLLFGISFIFQERAKGNSIANLLKKSNNTVGILRVTALFFFALHLFFYTFLAKAEFFNSVYRYVFLYLAVGALSLSQVAKHKYDRDPAGKVNLILYSLVLLVVLYSIVKLFI